MVDDQQQEAEEEEEQQQQPHPVFVLNSAKIVEEYCKETKDKDNKHANYPGIWVGLDLGTTHSSLAIWDTKLHRPKLLRLDIASSSSVSKKQGKFVPSAVLFLEDPQQDCFPKNTLVEVESYVPATNTIHNNYNRQNIKALVGTDACKIRNQSYNQNYSEDRLFVSSSTEVEGNITPAQVEAAFVSSSKRMFGRSVSACSQDFIRQLPFPIISNTSPITTTTNSNTSEVQIQIYPLSTKQQIVKPEPESGNTTATIGSSSNYNGTNNNTNGSKAFLIKPSQISSILMHSIREAAQRSLESHRLHPPGGDHDADCFSSSSSSSSSCLIRNVIIGVPAHYTLYQRHLVEHAAREAGFDGYVGTITESTAAALAYGLLTSSSFSKHTANNRDTILDNTINSQQKFSNILVFDMGGGTTDVTIVLLIKKSCGHSSSSEGFGLNDNKSIDEIQMGNKEDRETLECRVIATSGDIALGGDDIDELLTEWFLHQDVTSTDNSSTEIKTTDTAATTKPNNYEHKILRRACCMAKEDLCGDGNEQEPKNCVYIEHGSKRVKLSMEMFERIIEPVLQRAEATVDRAMKSFLEHTKYYTNNLSTDSTDINSVMDEVVLVGGGSRIPAIRNMLRKKFPPPHPPELCTAIDACSLVAMGTATQAAIISEQVPLHEIMSALMLDALPHTIGILTEDATDKNCTAEEDNKKYTSKAKTGQHFIPILMKDSPLPSSNYKTFELAHPCQKGITVQVVEYVGGGGIDEYQYIGEFTFLLHKLSTTTEQQILKSRSKRTVDVAISVDKDGNLTVSFFDWNDPEHLIKLRRYLSKRNEELDMDDSIYYHQLAANQKDELPQEQMLLILGCIIVIALYIFAKLLFQQEEAVKQSEL